MFQYVISSFLELLSFNHLETPHSIFYRLNLLFRASGLLAVRRLRLVIVFPLYDSMFLFHLSNIQVCYMKSVVLLHPFFDFLISSLCLSASSINLIQINLYLNMIIWFLLGQKNNSLHMRYGGYL